MQGAAADEQAAHARRKAAEAEARSHAAGQERDKARAHAQHATEIDPDA
jgi:hypothetical protein